MQNLLLVQINDINMYFLSIYNIYIAKIISCTNYGKLYSQIFKTSQNTDFFFFANEPLSCLGAAFDDNQIGKARLVLFVDGLFSVAGDLFSLSLVPVGLVSLVGCDDVILQIHKMLENVPKKSFLPKSVIIAFPMLKSGSLTDRLTKACFHH